MTGFPGLSEARTLIFVPGDRPERFDRALGSGADAVVLDLEDAVIGTAKDEARAHVRQALPGAAVSGVPVAVRVNDPATETGRRDLEALTDLGMPLALMVPKAAEPALLASVADELPSGSVLLPLVETAEGLLAAAALAQLPAVCRLVLGHLDLCAELGIEPDDTSRLWPARFALVTASAAAGIAPPVDGVTVEIRAHRTIHDDAVDALAGGFTGKLCIHPDQVAVVHEAFVPPPDQLAWAREVVDAIGAGSTGVGLVDGKMVDRPVLLRAQRLLARASDPSSITAPPIATEEQR